MYFLICIRDDLYGWFFLFCFIFDESEAMCLFDGVLYYRLLRWSRKVQKEGFSGEKEEGRSQAVRVALGFRTIYLNLQGNSGHCPFHNTIKFVYKGTLWILKQLCARMSVLEIWTCFDCTNPSVFFGLSHVLFTRTFFTAVFLKTSVYIVHIVTSIETSKIIIIIKYK